jgi:hypothetical protein
VPDEVPLDSVAERDDGELRERPRQDERHVRHAPQGARTGQTLPQALGRTLDVAVLLQRGGAQ